MENYLKILSPEYMKIMIKFCTTDHRLPMETGRWHGKPLGERFCTLCNNCQIGDKIKETVSYVTTIPRDLMLLNSPS